jgi:hypothetical protein
MDCCRCSSVVEHFLGKEEVDSSILFNGSKGFGRVNKRFRVTTAAEHPAEGRGGRRFDPVQRL